MPKKIEDLNEKIFKVAWDMFCNKGYEHVDMKGIAKGCNIAVGTLYNYFSNKRVLFEEVLRRSWEETLENISKRVNQGNDKNFKRDIIKILYYDIKSRKGLGMNILYSEDEVDNSINDVTKEIISILGVLFDKDDDIRLVEKTIILIICNSVIMVNKYPNHDEENIEFILNFLK